MKPGVFAVFEFIMVVMVILYIFLCSQPDAGAAVVVFHKVGVHSSQHGRQNVVFMVAVIIGIL